MTFTHPRSTKTDVKELEKNWAEMSKTIYELLDLDPKDLEKKTTKK